jgi:hypothetical protein
MLKQFRVAQALALSLGLSLSATTWAQSTPAPSPTSSDDCLKIAFDLAQTAEEKKLPESKLDPLEEMLTKMETQCDAKQFTEAMASAQSIKTLMETQ